MIIIVLWALGFYLQINRVISYEDSQSGALMVATFFTNHANLFVCISTVLLVLNIHNKHIERFHFITAFDITITGVVFFVLLLPFMPDVTFVQILLHGIMPPLYLLFYFFSTQTILSIEQAWIALIHPFIYFLFAHLIVHPLYGEYLFHIFPEEVDPYIYPFLNPAYFTYGWVGMLLVNYLLLFPVAMLLAYVILLAKHRINDRKKRAI